MQIMSAINISQEHFRNTTEHRKRNAYDNLRNNEIELSFFSAGEIRTDIDY